MQEKLQLCTEKKVAHHRWLSYNSLGVWGDRTRPGHQLFERIEVQLRQVMREKKMREGEGYTLDETLLASQLLAFCEGMLSRFVRSEFKYRPTDDFEARWPLVAAQLQ